MGTVKALLGHAGECRDAMLDNFRLVFYCEMVLLDCRL